jgi:hypothetical protein
MYNYKDQSKQVNVVKMPFKIVLDSNKIIHSQILLLI